MAILSLQVSRYRSSNASLLSIIKTEDLICKRKQLFSVNYEVQIRNHSKMTHNYDNFRNILQNWSETFVM